MDMLALASLLEQAAKSLREADNELKSIKGIERVPILKLNLTVRARKTVNRMLGWDTTHYLDELTRFSESDFLEVKNCGPTTLNELKEHLGRYGLRLKPEITL